MAKAQQAAASKPEAEHSWWGGFRQFESLLASGAPDLLEKIETTCRQLDAVVRDGSAQEKARARSALAAYARTLELYKHLAGIRNAMAAGQTQPEPASNR